MNFLYNGTFAFTFCFGKSVFGVQEFGILYIPACTRLQDRLDQVVCDFLYNTNIMAETQSQPTSCIFQPNLEILW
jgi:hypothetical protein